jgi:hypothetical protein
MGRQTLTNRVEVLERKVEILEKLPERMDSLELQFVQLREEMRAEFSTIHSEIRAGDEQTRTDLRAEIRAVDEKTRTGLRAEIRAGDEKTRTELRAEIRSGDEETRTYMRVFHEEVLSRIALLDEHWNGSARSRRPLKGARRRKKS